MGMAEYFVQGAWIGPASLSNSFVGNRSNRRLNQSLTGADHHDHTALLTDKYLTGLLLQAHGVPVPELRAVFATERSFGAVPTLRTAGDLAAWIADADNLPVFAKPVDGSMALGSCPMQRADQGHVEIGNQVVPIADLAAEVAQTYPRGWLIQDQIRQPEEVEAMIGPGVGTVRLVTLWEAGASGRPVHRAGTYAYPYGTRHAACWLSDPGVGSDG